jgi:hypothetical protein
MMKEKLLALFSSRRFWARKMGIAVSLMQEKLGVTPEVATQIVAVLIAWIVGDSLKTT